ncbi:hypothetical protein CPB85DRAFT_1327392 [Mucidula mucida]|nr:hypothetical protein CPB85DRAFT_1327392 [Mucidula mucida]
MASSIDDSVLLGTKRPLETDSANAVTHAPAKVPKTTKKAAPKRASNTGPGFCSLNTKDFGDKIKACFKLEKYDIQPMSFNVEMDVAFFRSFFGSAGVAIVPASYDESTPVVVATLTNRTAGAVFGVSKIKNGNRYSTYELDRMVVILYPSTKQAQVFVSI